jgi:hypothetical protein
VLCNRSLPAFRRNTLPPFSGSKSAIQASRKLKMEAICSPETLVDFYQTTRCNITEDSTLHSHFRENLRSNVGRVIWPFQCFIIHRRFAAGTSGNAFTFGVLTTPHTRRCRFNLLLRLDTNCCCEVVVYCFSFCLVKYTY